MIKKLKYLFLPFNSIPEYTLFICNILLMSFILININIIRIIKDSYISVSIGVELISFCKLFIELPLSVLFFYIYSVISRSISTEQLFRYIIMFFISIFLILPFYFPYYNHYSVIQLKNFIYLFHYWPYILYFVIAEIWPVISYTFLFWQFMNKFNSYLYSKKYYISYNLYAQISLLLSGNFINYYLSHSNYLNLFVNVFCYPINDIDEKIKLLSILIFLLGTLSIITHYLCERYYRLIFNYFHFTTQDIFFLSFKKSFIIIADNINIKNIPLMIFGYACSITLIHLTWLSALQNQYPSPIDFIQFQSYLNYITAVITVFLGIFSNRVISLFGISLCTKITSLFIILPGILFYFSCLFFNYTLDSEVILYSSIIGSIQYILVRSSKYIFFDTTKEILYTFIKNEELKTKIKFLSDIIAFKFGKLVGSLFLSIPLILFPDYNYITISPFIFLVFIAISYLWIKSINNCVKFYR